MIIKIKINHNLSIYNDFLDYPIKRLKSKRSVWEELINENKLPNFDFLRIF